MFLKGNFPSLFFDLGKLIDVLYLLFGACALQSALSGSVRVLFDPRSRGRGEALLIASQ